MFIVNKKAGTDGKKRFSSQVRRVLGAGMFSYKIAFTEYRGHATELARAAAAQNTDIIAAVGGDGSVNETARALVGTNSTLAVIPRGSGNGFARALGIPLNTARALSLLKAGTQASVDVGFAGEHLFLSNAGLGFDALVAELFADKKQRGLLNYARLVTLAIRRYRPATYLIRTATDEIEEKALFVAVANSNQFGYSFKIAPGARMDDGLLEVCIMKPLRWWQLPGVSLQALTGRLAGSRQMRYLRCTEVVIQGRERLQRMQVDGEPLPLERESIRITVRPKALTVLVP